MKQTVNWIPLKPEELVREHPFTHPNYIRQDRDVMLYMAKQLCMMLESYLAKLQLGRPLIIDEPDGRWHRYYVSSPTALLKAQRIFVVGFFGQKQKGAGYNHFGNLDDKLIAQIPTFQEILSYSTMALPDGNYSNLVLLTDEGIKLKWMEGETHNQAVARSPDYYRSIRINNGIFPEGIWNSQALQFIRVKYYDFGENPPWRAIRQLINDRS